MRRAERILIFFGALISALLVLLIVMMVRSDDSEPVAGDVSSSTEATTTTAIAEGSTTPGATDAPGTMAAPGVTETTDAPGVTETTDAPGTTVAPGTTEAPVDTTGGTETEFSWDSREISIDVSYTARDSPLLVFTWDDATGEDFYTWTFLWDTGGTAGGNSGSLPQDTDRHTIDAPCGANMAFELLAWDASNHVEGEELGGTLKSTRSLPCESLPSNLRSSRYGLGVRFEWDPATGHDSYTYEVTTSGGGAKPVTESGVLESDQQTFSVVVDCGTRVDFTLIAIAFWDGAEIGRVPGTFETDACTLGS